MDTGHDFENKSIALLLWNTEVENDAHVYLGQIRKEGVYVVFINEEKGWRVLLDADQLNRLRPVEPDLKAIFLNADLAISLSMNDLPDGPVSDMEQTNMKWN